MLCVFWGISANFYSQWKVFRNIDSIQGTFVYVLALTKEFCHLSHFATKGSTEILIISWKLHSSRASCFVARAHVRTRICNCDLCFARFWSFRSGECGEIFKILGIWNYFKRKRPEIVWARQLASFIAATTCSSLFSLLGWCPIPDPCPDLFPVSRYPV